MKTLKRSILSIAAIAFVGIQAAYAGGGAAQLAQSAMQAAAMSAAVSAATGSSLVPKCSAPGGQAACVLMGLAFAQVPLSLMSKSGSAKSASQLVGSGVGYGDSGAATTADPSSTYTTANGTTVTGETAKTANALVANGLGALADDYVKGVQTTRAKGIEVSDDGQSVKLPNGKTIPSSAMNSAEGMRNAGFSSAEIASAESALSDLQKNAASIQSKVAALTNDVGGGGGGGLSSRGSDGGSGYGSSDASLYGKLLGLKAKSDKSAVSGMSKKFGNDNIGVAGDDIFEMVSRRYQSKDKVDTFLKN
jgi:hypothetical protein